jgi:uncharacterized RDD family membrane protein YckC
MQSPVTAQISNLVVGFIMSVLVWHHYRHRRYDISRKYATFWPRFWTGAVDECILWPAGAVLAVLSLFHVPALWAVLAFAANHSARWVYTVGMHARYGQTIGKMVCGVKVIDARTEGRISFGQALVREAIPIVFMVGFVARAVWLLTNEDLTLADLLGGTDTAWQAMGRSFWILLSLPFLWFFAEAVTMLTNRKRRALHDFIAGTVVVRVNSEGTVASTPEPMPAAPDYPGSETTNMQTFACPACGKTIGAEVPAGSSVTCPLCQQVVTVPGDVPVAVAIPPTSPADPRWQGVSPRGVRQGLAIASMVLGIVGVATSCLPVLGLVALILGIVALVKASRRPGEYGGQGFAIAGVCLGGVSLLLCVVVLPMMLPSLSSRARELAKRSVCAANLSGTGMALRMYANQYNGQYPPDVDLLVSAGFAHPAQFICPGTDDNNKYEEYISGGTGAYTPGQPISAKLHEMLHSCYMYIPGQTPDSHPQNVLMHEKQDCHQGEGGNVLFADHSTRWLEPYSEVERLVEQTKARLAGGDATPEAPER